MNKEPGVDELVRYVFGEHGRRLGFTPGVLSVVVAASPTDGSIEVIMQHHMSGWRDSFTVCPVTLSRAARQGLEVVMEEIGRKIEQRVSALQYNLLNEWWFTVCPVTLSRAARQGLEVVVEEISRKIEQRVSALQHNLLNEWWSTMRPPEGGDR